MAQEIQRIPRERFYDNQLLQVQDFEREQAITAPSENFTLASVTPLESLQVWPFKTPRPGNSLYLAASQSTVWVDKSLWRRERGLAAMR